MGRREDVVRKQAWKGVFLVLVSFFILSTNSNAEAIDEKTEIEEIIANLQFLHKSGLFIQSLQTDSLDVLKKCVLDNGHLRDKAKGLRARAQNLGTYKYRFELTVAADSALSCVYCGARGNSCPDIPISIQRVRNYLEEDQRPAPKETPLTW